MNRWLVLLLVLALLVGAVWLGARRDGERRRTPLDSVAPVAQAETALKLASAPPPPRRDERTEGGARAPIGVTDPGASAVELAPAPLPRSVLAGKVVRADGAPVAGAEVVLESAFRSKLAPLARAETRADGSFRLEGPGTGPFRVEASERREDRVVTSAALEDVAGGRTDIEIVLPPTFPVHGRVVDELGRPVDKFVVVCRPLEPGAAAAERSVRGNDGEFLDELPPGQWSMKVLARKEHRGGEAVVTVPATAPVTIVVLREAVVRGVVVDQRGKPLPGAEVESSERTRRSDEAGRFELRIAPAPDVQLRAQGAGFAPSERLELALAPGEERNGLVLRLEALARVTGEVIGLDGRPLSGRVVALEWPDDGASSSNLNRTADRQPSTDARGRFEVEVPPGRVELAVLLEEEEVRALERQRGARGSTGHSCVRAVTVGPGEHAHVRLALAATPVRLHGRITLGGAPVRDASVTVLDHGGSGGGRAAVQDGEYEVLVPAPGSYTLLIQIDRAKFEPTVDVPEIDAHRFDVSLATGRVSGRVTDAAGRPLAGIFVAAMGEWPAHPFRSSTHTTTDAAGVYALEVVPGVQLVSAQAEKDGARALRNGEPRRVTVEESGVVDGVDLVLQDVATLVGTVRMTDGTYAQKARITGTRIALAGTEQHYTTSAEDGSFRVSLPGGRYRIGAIRDNRSARTPSAIAEPMTVELADGEVRSLELVLVPCAVVRVRLADAAGQPVNGLLEALDVRGRSFDTRTSDGRVHELELTPGSYRLRALRREELFERDLRVGEGEAELDVEFRLE